MKAQRDCSHSNEIIRSKKAQTMPGHLPIGYSLLPVVIRPFLPKQSPGAQWFQQPWPYPAPK